MARFSFVSLFLLALVLAVAAKDFADSLNRMAQKKRNGNLNRNSVNRRQDEIICPTPIPTLSLGDTVELTAYEDYDFSFCAVAQLNLPTIFNSDLRFTISHDSFGSGPLISLVRGEDYTGDGDSPDFQFPAGGFTIHNCALYSNTYYISASAGTGTKFNLTANAATSAPIRTVEAGVTLITGVATMDQIEFIEIPLVDPSHSNKVTAVNISSNNVEFIFSEGGCPTEENAALHIGGYSFDNKNFFRTRTPDVPLYLGVLTTNEESDYFIELSYEEVECQVPNPDVFEYCTNVDYETAVYDPEEIQNEEQFFGLIFLFVYGECGDVVKEVLCGSTFYHCDENGFPLLPCKQDCVNLYEACEDQLEITDPDACEIMDDDAIGTYCYTTSSAVHTVISGLTSSLLLVYLLLA